jgi:RND family efflux transporter MFP subunit
MKRLLKWFIVLACIGALALGVGRALSKRKETQAAAEAQAKVAPAPMQLAANDTVTLQTRTLTQSLAISGALKASNSALIKARTAGELLDLKLREGDPVKAGQLVARVDPTEAQWRIKQAQEQADAAKAQIDIAQRQFDNNRSLVDQGFISKTALDTSSMSLAGAQASHRAALAAVELAKKTLDDAQLRSPLTGYVAQRLAQPGERVGVDARVLEVVDLSRMELEATLNAADAVQVRLGQVASLQIDGLATPLSAKVVRINPSAQAGSRSVLVYLGLDNPGSLRQGMFAQGRLALGQQTLPSLPLTAVRTDKPRPYVQVVEGGQVVHRTVEPGARGEADGDTYVAISGLTEQTQVLVGGLGVLREGTAVKSGR